MSKLIICTLWSKIEHLIEIANDRGHESAKLRFPGSNPGVASKITGLLICKPVIF